MTYTYDMGDYWQHDIELVRVLDNYEEESPYLVEIKGQAPPEDVGGVGGFIRFREIMLDESNPEYDEFKQWAGYWNLELDSYESSPKLIHIR